LISRSYCYFRSSGESGYFTEAELDKQTKAFLAKPKAALPGGGDAAVDARVLRYIAEGDSPKRDVPFAPRFAVGDRVMAKHLPEADHTRLPGFLRGKTGIVTEVYDAPYAYHRDTGPDGIGAPMPVYCNAFRCARALGGEGGSWIHDLCRSL